MSVPYTEIVMEHFRNPRNVGRIEDADAKSVEGSPACGDMVAVYIKVDSETKRLSDVKFESYGCASNIATGSIITEMAKGKTLEEAKNITWDKGVTGMAGEECEGKMARREFIERSASGVLGLTTGAQVLALSNKARGGVPMEETHYVNGKVKIWKHNLFSRKSKNLYG